METEIKSNVIPFPLEKRVRDIKVEEFLAMSNQYDACVALARHCIDLIGAFMPEQDFVDPGFVFDPTKDPQQFSDMFVILNLLVASFLRNADIKHILQDDLDELLLKIEYLENDTS